MSCLFQITIDPAFVTVQIPEKGYVWRKPNLVAYDLKDKRIGVIFESAFEIKQKLQIDNLSITEYVICPAFHPHDADPYVMVGTLEYLVTTIYEEVRPWSFLGWMLGLVTIDYEWHISDYDQYSSDLKRQFEYTLQTGLGAGKLSVNGASLTIDKWKRDLEAWIRKLLPLGPSAGLMIGGYLVLASPSLLAYPLTWLWIIGFGLIMVFVEPIWAVLTRTWLPHDYLRYLCKSRGMLSHLTRELTLRLLS